jgi:hypothetical protein
MTPRHSWLELHGRWAQADHVLKARGEQAYRMKRALLMPPKLDGRTQRMVKRIVRNVELLTHLQRTQSVDWLRGGNPMARWQIADSIRALRRHIARPADHPRGGLWGRTSEFSPLLRAYLRGETTDAEFETRMGWALRLLENVQETQDAG